MGPACPSACFCEKGLRVLEPKPICGLSLGGWGAGGGSECGDGVEGWWDSQRGPWKLRAKESRLEQEVDVAEEGVAGGSGFLSWGILGCGWEPEGPGKRGRVGNVHTPRRQWPGQEARHLPAAFKFTLRRESPASGDGIAASPPTLSSFLSEQAPSRSGVLALGRQNRHLEAQLLTGAGRVVLMKNGSLSAPLNLEGREPVQGAGRGQSRSEARPGRRCGEGGES